MNVTDYIFCKTRTQTRRSVAHRSFAFLPLKLLHGTKVHMRRRVLGQHKTNVLVPRLVMIPVRAFHSFEVRGFEFAPILFLNRLEDWHQVLTFEIGRASCRER